MGALTPMVFKGILTNPLTDCCGCPGTHTFKGLSLFVHHGCPGAHTFWGTLAFCTLWMHRHPHFLRKKISSFLFSCTVYDSIHALALFFYWSTGPLQRERDKSVSVCVCVCACAHMCVLILIWCSFHPHVTAVACKRPLSFWHMAGYT